MSCRIARLMKLRAPGPGLSFADDMREPDGDRAGEETNSMLVAGCVVRRHHRADYRPARDAGMSRSAAGKRAIGMASLRLERIEEKESRGGCSVRRSMGPSRMHGDGRRQIAINPGGWWLAPPMTPTRGDRR
jgi:hypothetical protein